jgi:hypothetical protein
MSQVDTSFYPTQQSAPQNPLQTYGEVVGIQNAQQQNQLLQQSVQHSQGANQLQQLELEKQQAVQDAFSQPGAIDPRTGVPNIPLISNRLTQSRGGRLALLQQQQQMQDTNSPATYLKPDGSTGTTGSLSLNAKFPGQNPNAGQVPSQDKIDDLHDHLNEIESTLTPIASNPNATQKDAISGVTDLITNDKVNFTPQDGVKAFMDLPSGPNGQDPTSQQIQQHAQQQIQKVRATRQQLLQRGLIPSSMKQQQQQPANTDDLGGYQTGMSPAQAENQHAMYGHFNDVQNDASGAGQQIATLNKIYDLTKTTPTGQLSGKVYQYLAERGLATPGVEKSAEQLQEIEKGMAQLNTQAGLPNTNDKLAAVQASSVHPEQLPGAIQNLIPSLLAQQQGKLAKASYYSKQAGNGTNPDQVQQARDTWNQHFDPSVLELQNLQKLNPDAYQARVANMNTLEKSNLAQKLRGTKENHLLDGFNGGQ